MARQTTVVLIETEDGQVVVFPEGFELPGEWVRFSRSGGGVLVEPSTESESEPDAVRAEQSRSNGGPGTDL
jgi:virulence-associated protein VagC